MVNFSKVFLFLCLFYSMISLAQKKVYIDENKKEIDSVSFYKKCDARVLYCLAFKTDSLIVNKIYNSFSFGKISNEEYDQIRLLLMKKGNLEITPNQTLVINHIDSIDGSYAAYLKRMSEASLANKLQNPPNRKQYVLTEKRYDKFYKNSLKTLAKCTKRFQRKNNTKVITTYKYNGHLKHNFKGINWIEYPGVIIPKFLSKVRLGSFVIIKPDGEYFVSKIKIKDSFLESLFDSNDWTQHKEDLKSLTRTGKGMFRPFLVIDEKYTLCF